ncbi:MAG: MbnP family copper-binding protein [Pleurocapsa sp.]
MFLAFKQKSVLLAVGIAFTTYGHVQAQTNNQDVAINFEAWVGDREFSCGESYEGVGVNESTITPTDFRFYVSDVALIDEAGNAVPLELKQDGKWQHQNVALLDFEDGTSACDNGTAEMNTVVVGTVPEGDYQSLQFTMGVPQNLNHSDAAIAPSPLNLTSMWWNWQGGYKFLRVDLETEAIANVTETSGGHSNQTGIFQHEQTTHPDAGSNAYLIHLGSTGCSESAQSDLFGCANPNRVNVVLEDFSFENNVVVADLAELLAESDLTTNEANTPNGCMSSPEDADCLPIMQSLNLSSGNVADSEQNFFWVE